MECLRLNCDTRCMHTGGHQCAHYYQARTIFIYNEVAFKTGSAGKHIQLACKCESSGAVNCLSESKLFTKANVPTD